MEFFNEMEFCFQDNYLKNLKNKTIFRKKLSEKQNLKNIFLKKYCNNFLRLISYSPKFIGNVILNGHNLSFLKILTIEWFLNINWSNFFPKKSKKQEKNFKILNFTNFQTYITKNLFITIEIGIQIKNKIELGLSFNYFRQYSYFHFQKNKILEYWDKIIIKKNLPSFNLSLNSISNSYNKLKKYSSLKLKNGIHFFYLKLLKLQQKFMSIFFFYPNSNSKYFFYFQFSLFFRSFILNWATVLETISQTKINFFYQHLFFSTKVTVVQEFFFNYSVARILFSLKKINPPIDQDSQNGGQCSLFIDLKHLSQTVDWKKNIENLNLQLISKENYFPGKNEEDFYLKKLEKYKIKKISFNPSFQKYKKLYSKVNCKNSLLLYNFIKTIETCGLKFEKDRIDFILFENLFFSFFILEILLFKCLDRFAFIMLLSNRKRLNNSHHILLAYQQCREKFLFF